MDLIPILALWGTIVSTVEVTWNIIRSSQDKNKKEASSFYII